MAKHGEFVVQSGMLPIGDKELTSIFVGSKISHGKSTSLVVTQLIPNLVFKELTVDGLAALARARWISTLDNEAPNILVQLGSNVVVGGAQSQEIVTSLGCFLACQLKLKIANSLDFQCY